MSKYHQHEALAEVVTELVGALEQLGFGSECAVNGGDCVEVINCYFKELRDALAAVKP